MNKITINPEGDSGYCDACGGKVIVYTLNVENTERVEKGKEKIDNYFCDLCDSCLMSLGRSIRKRAVNKILEIKKGD